MRGVCVGVNGGGCNRPIAPCHAANGDRCSGKIIFLTDRGRGREVNGERDRVRQEVVQRKITGSRKEGRKVKGENMNVRIRGEAAIRLTQKTYSGV